MKTFFALDFSQKNLNILPVVLANVKEFILKFFVVHSMLRSFSVELPVVILLLFEDFVALIFVLASLPKPRCKLVYQSCRKTQQAPPKIFLRSNTMATFLRIL